jgi:hypothetical protein
MASTPTQLIPTGELAVQLAPRPHHEDLRQQRKALYASRIKEVG